MARSSRLDQVIEGESVTYRLTTSARDAAIERIWYASTRRTEVQRDLAGPPQLDEAHPFDAKRDASCIANAAPDGKKSSNAQRTTRVCGY